MENGQNIVLYPIHVTVLDISIVRWCISKRGQRVGHKTSVPQVDLNNGKLWDNGMVNFFWREIHWTFNAMVDNHWTNDPLVPNQCKVQV